jgi:phosphatidylserine/phosphatidylglycerophosphate/cardiolipin synthase-like enzyme
MPQFGDLAQPGRPRPGPLAALAHDAEHLGTALDRRAAIVLALVSTGAGAAPQPRGASLDGSAAASAASAAAPARAQWRPQEGARFNVPRARGANMFRLEAQVLEAIRHAHKDSVIRFSMYSFDRLPIAQALIRAKQRGVSVQVLVNDHEVTRAQRLLRARLGTDRSRRSWIHQCRNGCRSSGEQLHDKFYLFSHTGGARWVVMVGSINMKLNGHKNQYNDLWTRNDDRPLYDGMDALFRRLARDRLDRPTYWVQDIGRIRVYATPLPNFGPTNDPIMDVLRPVVCRGAKGPGGRTVIRVVMHSWGQDRGVYLARRLRNLYGAGCDVRLLYGLAGAKVRAELARPTRRGRIPIRSTGYDTNDDGELDLYTHQKNLFIAGHYGDRRAARIVVTGSSNWTGGGIRGDELVVVVVDGLGTLPAHQADFAWLWSKRSHSVGWSPTPGHDYVPAPTGGGLTRAELAWLAPRVEPRLPGPRD